MPYNNRPHISRDKLISVRAPEEIHNAALARYAKAVGRTKGTISNLINYLLKQYIESNPCNNFTPPVNGQVSFEDLRGL